MRFFGRRSIFSVRKAAVNLLLSLSKNVLGGVGGPQPSASCSEADDMRVSFGSLAQQGFLAVFCSRRRFGLIVFYSPTALLVSMVLIMRSRLGLPMCVSFSPKIITRLFFPSVGSHAGSWLSPLGSPVRTN